MDSLYRVCGHCDKLVSEKTFKEHKRLFFHGEDWIRKESAGDQPQGSRNSSPLCLSDPSEMPSCSSHQEMDSSSCNFSSGEDFRNAEDFSVNEDCLHPDGGNQSPYLLLNKSMQNKIILVCA